MDASFIGLSFPLEKSKQPDVMYVLFFGSFWTQHNEAVPYLHVKETSKTSFNKDQPP